MSKYIDEIHACAGDERETMALMEKSVTKILLDVVLFIVLILNSARKYDNGRMNVSEGC